jgi:hypothetical protein
MRRGVIGEDAVTRPLANRAPLGFVELAHVPQRVLRSTRNEYL